MLIERTIYFNSVYVDAVFISNEGQGEPALRTHPSKDLYVWQFWPWVPARSATILGRSTACTKLNVLTDKNISEIKIWKTENENRNKTGEDTNASSPKKKMPKNYFCDVKNLGNETLGIVWNAFWPSFTPTGVMFEAQPG